MEAYTHILQKTGVLKSFTVAKIVKKQEIEDLKKLIKDVAVDEEEYKQLLEEELAKISNMHDRDNPIPGIIYGVGTAAKRHTVVTMTKKIAQIMKDANLEKKDLALLISAIITELGLTQEDFVNLKKDLEEEAEDYDDDEDDSEEGDEEEYED